MGSRLGRIESAVWVVMDEFFSTRFDALDVSEILREEYAEFDDEDLGAVRDLVHSEIDTAWQRWEDNR